MVKLLDNPGTISQKCLSLLKKESECNKHKEHFWLIMFRSWDSNKVKVELISIGSMDKSVVHPREVFCPAIYYRARYLVICHNHPQDSVDPSQDDVQITKQLVKCSQFLDIPIVDHIIINEVGDYFSFLVSKQFRKIFVRRKEGNNVSSVYVRYMQ